jgi:hypothetical protein
MSDGSPTLGMSGVGNWGDTLVGGMNCEVVMINPSIRRPGGDWDFTAFEPSGRGGGGKISVAEMTYSLSCGLINIVLPTMTTKSVSA